MGRERTIYRILAIAAASLGVLASLWYVSLNQNFDASTLLAGVVFPLAFGSAVLLATNQRIALFVFVAYFWSIVDDGPVFFDSVLTWPEVTRFHPATPHIFLEVLLHALTLLFMALAVREALKGTRPALPRVLGIVLLTSAAFILSYAQNIPVDAVQTVVQQEWYQLDVAEHAGSLVVLAVAILIAMMKENLGGSASTTAPGRRDKGGEEASPAKNHY